MPGREGRTVRVMGARLAALALLAAGPSGAQPRPTPPAKPAATPGAAKPAAKPAAKGAATGAAKGAAKPPATADSGARERAWLQAADDARYAARLEAGRGWLLARAGWAPLGERCDPGALRVFPVDTTPAQRDTLQREMERMEAAVLAAGVGGSLATPEARALLQVVLAWEAGILRPRWDVADGEPPRAFAAGLTGEVPDPRGPGCLPSPVARDTVTVVVPGVADLPLPGAPRPRIKAYFGADAPRHVRDEFYAAVGARDPEAALAYLQLAPVVVWREWALTGVRRPVERGGVAVAGGSEGGAVYLWRLVGREWRLVTVVRSWG